MSRETEVLAERLDALLVELRTQQRVSWPRENFLSALNIALLHCDPKSGFHEGMKQIRDSVSRGAGLTLT